MQSALEQSERRCEQLEKRVEVKSRYENLIKHCQRLQCQECSKLYTPPLFHQHYQACKRAGHRPSQVFSVNDRENSQQIEEDDEVLVQQDESEGTFFFEGGEQTVSDRMQSSA